MFKLYQVVHGKACLAGYSSRGKLPLLQQATELRPVGVSKKTVWEKTYQTQAYVDGNYL